MQSNQQFNADLDLMGTLKTITQAYEELSVMRMQRIRNSVLKTRDFLEHLSRVFFDVKTSYKKQIEQLLAKQHKEKINPETLHFKKNKTASIYISANAKMYGDIINKTFRYFLEHVRNNDTDIVIVGKIGKELYENTDVKKPYTYFDLPDVGFTLEQLKPLINKMLDYENVNVFYGKFENMMQQNATFSNVSGEQPFEATQAINNREPVRYFIFEPSLEKILNFFEKQIFTSLFKQTVHESQLARFASRIKAMEEATVNIENNIKKLYIQQRKLKHLTQNKKQITAMSGIALWSR
jgi:ATP synthase F1 gamma subunit